MYEMIVDQESLKDLIYITSVDRTMGPVVKNRVITVNAYIIHDVLATIDVLNKLMTGDLQKFIFTDQADRYWEGRLQEKIEPSSSEQWSKVEFNIEVPDGVAYAVELIPGSELTWMRQPHYYMGLYSYTYSAGLTIATQSYLNVADGKPGAVNDWLKYLKLGTQPVVDAAKVAGVDVTTDKPLKHTIAYLDQTVDEIIAYSHALAKTHSEVNAYVTEQAKAKETVKVERHQEQSGH